MSLLPNYSALKAAVGLFYLCAAFSNA